MACRGVHFALTADEAARLESLDDEQERLAYLQEELEERYFAQSPEWLAESDKAWDAMHRALSGGQLDFEGGSWPLNHVVLGGTQLYSDDDYILSLKSPDQVRAVAAALAPVDEAAFRHRYDAIDADSYEGELGDEDFEYTWEWFQGVRALFGRAAAEGRYVVFAVDQ